MKGFKSLKMHNFLKRKIQMSIFFVVFVIFVSFFSFSYIYMQSMRDSLSELAESSFMAEAKMSNIIESYYSTLKNISSVAALYADDSDRDFFAKKLQNVKVSIIDTSLRLYLKDGYLVTEDQIIQNGLSMFDFDKIISDEKYVSPIHQDPFHPEREIIEHFYPVYKNETLIGSLCAVTDVQVLQNYVIEASKRSGGFIKILDRGTGEFLINTKNDGYTNIDQFKQLTPKKGFSLDTLFSEIQKKIPTRFVVKNKGYQNDTYYFVVPSSYNKWSIFSEMDEAFLFRKLFNIRRAYLIMSVIVFTAFFIYVFCLYRDLRRQISEESREYTGIAVALSACYDAIYYVDTTDDTYLEFFRQGTFKKLNEILLSEKNYFEECTKNIQKYIYPNDYTIIEPYLYKDYILNELKKGYITSPAYRLMIDGKNVYYRIKIIASQIDQAKLIIAMENVDAEMQKDMNQQFILENALEKAEFANKAKTLFLNNMSHDIRTPMNAIIGYTKIAIDEYNKNKSDKVVDYLNKVMLSSNHLLSLINDILDMSRIEAGKVTISEREENLKDIINSISDLVSTDLNKKNQELIIETQKFKNVDIFCDKLRLNQILLNVISNSIKYTHDGGKIILSVSQKESIKNGFVYEFIIKDNGIGMSEEFLENIFEPFTRARNSTISGIQGTGLGMSITKSLVEMFGGTIFIKSKENVGTETILRIPFKIVETVFQDVEFSQFRHKVSLKGTRVLLVDDNDFNREIAHIILENEGCEVTEATDGEQAVQKVRENIKSIYDLILMDIQMPKMNGYEATKIIRRMEEKEGFTIPIIAMTANAFEEDKKLSLEAGMNEYLSKPIDIPKLMDVLEKFSSFKSND